jgi:hypothetical protein
MTKTEECTRCGRAARIDDVVHWEPVGDGHGARLGAVCEWCLTAEERSDIDNDALGASDEEFAWVEDDDLLTTARVAGGDEPDGLTPDDRMWIVSDHRGARQRGR